MADGKLVPVTVMDVVDVPLVGVKFVMLMIAEKSVVLVAVSEPT